VRRRRLALLVPALAVLLTCTDTVEPPVAGWADILMTSPTPTPSDGGILFTLGGARIDSIRTGFPRLFTERGQDGSWHVIVAGDLAPGVIAQVWVPDTRNVDGYRGTVEQVTARETHIQRTATRYTITVTTPPVR